MLLVWLVREYPLQFALADGGAVIETLSKGYCRRFLLAEWTDRPLVLVGLLVQEDFCERPSDSLCCPVLWGLASERLHGKSEFACLLDLLEEQDVGGAAAPPPPAGANLEEAFDYDEQDHKEEHPTGKQHVFLSACSCFSFEAVPRCGPTLRPQKHF